MRLRNNFIELLHSGELSPELVDWMQLEPDDFFYIQFEETKTTAKFIKTINSLIRDYKVRHCKVSSSEEREREQLHKQMPFIRHWKMLINLNRRYREYYIHRNHFNKMVNCLLDYDGDNRSELLAFMHMNESNGWNTHK
jgi:hypothetical protein|tara:strand:+ start:485 stop:901 length:417 start_codon:yes stop_codon:yes gene_type:complete